jgi:hypothetical protein
MTTAAGYRVPVQQLAAVYLYIARTSHALILAWLLLAKQEKQAKMAIISKC